ncbi:SRPBCC family protein [Algoriphagus sp. SE2]|uniref:SRPBCC family protein n=1 Tax=Algoriphagus sp. SE2 TaxID=3141536 RepID=UPI0031CD542A
MASEMIVEKSVVIDQPKDVVFEYLRFSKNMDQYSVWNIRDPYKKAEYYGKDGTVGFVYKWDSKDKNVGAGEQKITKLVQNERIEYEMKFERPMKNTGTSKFILSDVNEKQTMVTWDFRGPVKFPMSLFKGFFQKMLGKDLMKSLENLKKRLE